jgi:tRNA(Ile)-lysidine synthase
VSQVWSNTVSEQPNGIALDNEAFSTLPPALKRHLLRAALQHLLGDLEEVKSFHIESLIKALARPAGKRLSLPRELSFHGDYRYSVITREAATVPFPVLSGEHGLNVPGETILPGWQVTASILECYPGEGAENDLGVYLDFDVTGRELFVRGRRPGDRFQPLGLAQPKKLQDFMVDAKIPRSWRDRVPLVCSAEHILWVVGWRIDHRVRVSPQTKRILFLELKKLDSV